MRRFVPIIFFIVIFGSAPSAVSAQLMRGNVPIGATGAARGYQVPTQSFPAMTACDSKLYSQFAALTHILDISMIPKDLVTPVNVRILPANPV